MTQQSDFTEALLDPKAPVPQGVIDPSGRGAGKRFDVYRNNVMFSLIEALRVAFPVIARLLGEPSFTEITRVYIKKHPPKTPVILFYGADFPEFLEGFEAVAHLPYLADVARLELARRLAYHAGDAVAVTGADLQAVPAEDLGAVRFDFAPCAMVLQSPYPVANIWRANMDEAVDIGVSGVYLLVFRPELDVMFREISAADYHFIDALRKGENLENAGETSAEMATKEAVKSDATDFDLTGAIRLLLETRIVCGIRNN